MKKRKDIIWEAKVKKKNLKKELWNESEENRPYNIWKKEVEEKKKKNIKEYMEDDPSKETKIS